MKKYYSKVSLVLLFLLALNFYFPKSSYASMEIVDFSKKTEVSIFKQWEIKFDKKVDPKSINDETIFIVDNIGKKVPLNYEVADNIVKIKPSNYFEPNSTYYLHIENINNSSENVNMEFTTINSMKGEINEIPKDKWIKNNLFSCNNLNDIVFNEKDLYIAVGDNGTILASKDCEKWTRVNANTTKNLKKILYNGKEYLIVGDDVILRSIDGLVWSEIEIDIYSLNLSKTFKDMLEGYGNPDLKLNADDLIWDGNKFVAIFSPKHSYQRVEFLPSILTSADGVQWEYCYFVEGNNPKIVWDGTDYILYYDHYENGYMFKKSKELHQWTDVEKNDFIKITAQYDFKYINGKYIICGYDGGISSNYDGHYMSGIAYISDDLEKWSEVKLKEQWNAKANAYISESGIINGLYQLPINCINYVNEQYILGADYGMVLRSQDGENWKQNSDGVMGPSFLSSSIDDIGKNAHINKIIWDGNKYIAVGSHGSILSSNDLIEWNCVKETEGEYFLSCLCTKNNYIMVSTTGNVFVSNDGADWKNLKTHFSELNSYIIEVDGVAYIITGNGYYGTLSAYKFEKEELARVDDAKCKEILLNKEIKKVTSNENKILGESFKEDKTKAYKIIDYDFKINNKYFKKWKYAIIENVDDIENTENILWTNCNLYGLNGEKMPDDYIDDRIGISINMQYFINGQYIRICDNGMFAISDNGLDWYFQKIPTSALVHFLAWDGEKYILGGNNGNLLYYYPSEKCIKTSLDEK